MSVATHVLSNTKKTLALRHQCLPWPSMLANDRAPRAHDKPRVRKLGQLNLQSIAHAAHIITQVRTPSTNPTGLQ